MQRSGQPKKSVLPPPKRWERKLLALARTIYGDYFVVEAIEICAQKRQVPEECLLVREVRTT